MKCQVCGTQYEGRFCTGCGAAMPAVPDGRQVSNAAGYYQGSVCPRCGSRNVVVQVINEIELKNKHHSIIWWVLLGWWWVPIKWLFLTVPALIVKLFGHKKQRAVNRTRAICVCQNCGSHWNV